MTTDGAPSSSEFPAAAHFVGVGVSSDAAPSELQHLVDQALHAIQITSADVAAVATIDTRLDHPAVTALGWLVVAFTAAALASVATPNPSPTIENLTGSPSVAEAAALLAAGPGAELIVAKRTSAHATVAVARSPLSSDRPTDQEHP